MVDKFTQVQKQAAQIQALAGRLAAQSQYEPDAIQAVDVEALYSKVGNLSDAVLELTEDFYDTNSSPEAGSDGTVSVPVRAISFEHEGYVGIVFDAPPVLKTSIGVRTFADEFCVELQRKLALALPANFKKYSSAYIIYVSHFDAHAPKKQPYFDNDNLAIKQILDVVVPTICLDDAANFCDNLYFSESDSACFTELFVVEKSNILGWLRDHRGIAFCRNIVQFSP